MNFLVTGAGGFVGSNLCFALESLGHSVVACDDFAYSQRANLEGFNGKVLALSSGKLEPSHLRGIDAVFHQAAISDPTLDDEQKIMQVNLHFSVRLMDMCMHENVPFIYASSSAVYGNTKLPNKEFEAEKPLNAYARSKLLLDKEAVSRISKGSPSQIAGLRYFNIYGPREWHKGKTASMVHHFAMDILNGKTPVVYGDGTQKRDFVYVKDVVDANLAALESRKSGVANIGSGHAVQFNSLISIIAGQLGKTISPVHKNNPYSEKYQFATEADLSLARSLFGFSPKWGIEKGVADYIPLLKARL